MMRNILNLDFVEHIRLKDLEYYKLYWEYYLIRNSVKYVKISIVSDFQRMLEGYLLVSYYQGINTVG